MRWHRRASEKEMRVGLRGTHLTVVTLLGEHRLLVFAFVIIPCERDPTGRVGSQVGHLPALTSSPPPHVLAAQQCIETLLAPA